MLDETEFSLAIVIIAYCMSEQVGLSVSLIGAIEDTRNRKVARANPPLLPLCAYRRHSRANHHFLQIV